MSTFRLNGKNLFITYSQCDLDPAVILASIRTALNSIERRVINYVVAEEEHKDGGVHRHCYLELDIAVSKTVKVDFFNIRTFHPNIQTAKSIERVIGYITKDGHYITSFDGPTIQQFIEKYGKLKEKKMSKAEVGTRLLNGEPLEKLVGEYPQLIFDYMKLKGAFQLYSQHTKVVEDLDDVCGIWLYGPAGSGKTRSAYHHWSPLYHKSNSIWWDGYNEEYVLADDVDSSWKDIQMFKIWADRRAFNAQVKGSTIKIRPKKFIVTSNYTIEELLSRMGFSNDKPLLDALMRRFSCYRIDVFGDLESQL